MPIAAASQPTPLLPKWIKSNETDTMSTPSTPRTSSWATKQPTMMAMSTLARSSVSPPSRASRGPSRDRRKAFDGSTSTLIAETANAPPRLAAADTTITTRRRENRSAAQAPNGRASAPGSRRARPRTPTADVPPCRKAHTDKPTIEIPSTRKYAAHPSCSRRRSRDRITAVTASRRSASAPVLCPTGVHPMNRRCGSVTAQKKQRRVVAVAVRPSGIERGPHLASDLLERSRTVCAKKRDQLGATQCLRNGSVGDTIGVEHDEIARCERDRVDLDRWGDDAEQRAIPPEIRDGAAGVDAHAAVVAGKDRSKAAVEHVENGVSHGAVGRVGLGDDCVVHPFHDARLVADVSGCGTKRVACRTGDRRGRGALAADVAEHHSPAPIVDPEDVVEVAADLHVGQSRPILHVQVEAVDRGELAWQQAGLQRFGDGPLTLLDLQQMLQCSRCFGRGAGASDRSGSLFGDELDEAAIGIVEAPGKIAGPER